MKHDLSKKISCLLFLVFVLTGCSLANSRWTHYPLEEAPASLLWAFSIEEDLDGNLWVATGSALRIPIFDPLTES